MAGYRRPYKENVKLQYMCKFVTDLAVVITLAYFLVANLCDRTIIRGNSMSPTMENEEILLINKFEYAFNSPERYDIIVFETSGINTSDTYVKRVIGLPGETVLIENGKVYIDGRLLEELSDMDILVAGLATSEVVLGEDEYFVLGDNANSSEDSRFANVGNIKKEDIIGTVWLRVSPMNRIGIVK